MQTNTATEKRNKHWETNPHIPSWVDPRKVGLDQFYTRAEIASKCYSSLADYMRSDGADTEVQLC